MDLQSQDQRREEALARLRDGLEIGYEQVMRGETVDAEEVFEEIRQMSKAARRAASVRDGDKLPDDEQ